MTKVSYDNLTATDYDVYADLEVEGTREKIVETVAMHARDEAIRAMQAFEEGKPPYECEGSGISINWDKVLEDYEGGDD